MASFRLFLRINALVRIGTEPGDEPMTQRIPEPGDEAFDTLLGAIETVNYMAGLALTAARKGDMENVRQKLYILRFLIRHNVIDMLDTKDGEDR